MNLNELKEKMFELNAEIKDLLDKTGFSKYEELDQVEIDSSNPNELFVLKELVGACYKLSEASDDIKHEYTCGNTIEFMYYDEFDERNVWAVSSVEHDGNDYYITGSRYKNVKLDGLTVRQRR